ncbi:MAG TPA: efflux RND transporter permease subunit, partial [Chloroflexota bacterium]|nr:efflux RND transporter permease subunit [Chloroflexota bacterium]
QPVFITMLVLAVIVVGVLAYGQMGLDLFPDVSLPVVVVQTTYPGASPSAVADTVSKPIEDAVSGINGVQSVHSTSTSGVSLVVVEFAMNADPRASADLVRARLNLAQSALPGGVSTPLVETFDPSAAPILTVAVADTSGTRSPEDLRSFADQVVAPDLERVGGVAAVQASGGAVRDVQVSLHADRLQKYGLSPERVVQAIQAANQNVPAGTVPSNARVATLQTGPQVNTPDQLASLPVTTLPDGTIIRVRDLATVAESTQSTTSLTRLDGRPSVILAVQKQSGANTVQVSEATRQELDAISARYPNITFATAFDQATYTRQSIGDLQNSLLIGAVIAWLVVLLFFRDLRGALITVAGLPLVLLGSVAVLNLLGVTLNMISMLAMSLSIGMLIDDAIVVRENIFRHVERGEAPPVAASRGTAEIASAVVAVTATIVAVFLPIGFTQGIAGKFLRDFGLTVAVAVLISLVEAFTFAPMLSAYFFRSSRRRPVDVGFSHVLAGFYKRSLAWTLGHGFLVLLIALLSLLATGVLFGQLPFSFAPAGDQGTFTVTITTPPGTPLATTDAKARAVEGVVRPDSAVRDEFTTVGSAQGTTNTAQIIVTLKATGQTPGTVERLRPKIQNAIPGTTVAIDTQSSTASLGGGAAANAVTSDPIQYSVRGSDPVAVDKVSSDLARRLSAVPGAIDVDRSAKPGAPGLAVVLDRDKAAANGLTAAQVGATLRAMVTGETARTLTYGGSNLPIDVRLQPSDRANPTELSGLPIATARGTTVSLGDIGHLEQVTEPSQVDRADRLNEVVVGAGVLGRSTGAVQSDAQAIVNQLNPPAGVSIEPSGQTKYTADMVSALGLSMGLAVLFVYMILASLFGSFLQPLIIMLALPFSLVGAVTSLYLARFDFDMLAMIGLILLMGLVAKNSILLVDLANRQRRLGANGREAMLVAGPVRLRPILMTTFAMIGGMLPVAIGVGAGAEIRRPMGLAVIGGLITSTVLTLLVVPAVYTLIADATSWFGRRSLPGWPSSIARRGAIAWIVGFLIFGAILGSAASASDRAATPVATPTPAISSVAVIPTFSSIPASDNPPAPPAQPGIVPRPTVPPASRPAPEPASRPS